MVRKKLWLIGKGVAGRIQQNPFQFIITVLGLCVCAIASMVVLQYILGNGWQLTDTGKVVKTEHFALSEMALYLVIGVALIAFALANLIMLFRHLSRIRRKTYLTYKMFGCSMGMIFCLSFFELLFYTLLGGGLAAGLYLPVALWLKRMHCTVFPQAYWGLAVYAAAVLIAAVINSLMASGVRLNRREG